MVRRNGERSSTRRAFARAARRFLRPVSSWTWGTAPGGPAGDRLRHPDTRAARQRHESRRVPCTPIQVDILGNVPDLWQRPRSPSSMPGQAMWSLWPRASSRCCEGHATRRSANQAVSAGDGWRPLDDLVSKDIFKAEVVAWARRIGAEPREVHMRPMKRKWGSCSTNGRVSFNTDILREPAEFRRRVIVEELLHLKVPNHGRLFRGLLKSYLAQAWPEGRHGRSSAK